MKHNRLTGVSTHVLGGNSNIVSFHPYFGEMIRLDEHIFQMGGEKTAN